MFKLRPRLRRLGCSLLLLPTAPCLVAGTALAVPVTDYITVQPIDVCPGIAGSTAGCAPINNLSSAQGGNNYATAAVGNIGSIDVTPSGNINVTRAIWDQIGIDVTFLPAVQDPNAGSFLTLSVASCAANGTDCQSPQFQTLSQQPGISGNPPPPILPTPPLNPNPTTINTFFVSALSPPAGTGTLYGLAWVNNNGVAIASNSLLGLGARPDTLAHELGHDTALDHTTFGAGDPNNLMTAGKTRLLPTSAASAVSGIGAGLGAGMTDQLLATQQTQMLLSGFMNPIPFVNTPATGTDFNVSFVSGGRPGEKLDKLTLTAPAGFLFNPATVVSLSNPNGLTVNPAFTNCGDSGCTTLVLDFTKGTPFLAGDSLDYTLCVFSGDSCVPISVDNLAGGTYTYNFETDIEGVPVELFQTTSELIGPGDLSSNSQDPDPLFPSEILNPSTFVGFSVEPCTIIAPATTCPPLVLADAFPPDEDQPVPEPPAVLLLLSALAILPVAYRFSSRARPSMEAGLA